MKPILRIILLTLACLALISGKPPIGISTGIGKDGSPTVNPSYAKCISDGGGSPIVLPTISSQRQADSIVATLSGIVFTGGADFDPAYYGEKILNESVKIDSRRDSSDMFLGKAALKAGIPILGICRGCQLLGILQGGSLYQDIPTQKRSAVVHNQKASAEKPTHRVDLVKGSFLQKAIGSDNIMVNSFHHQAIKDEGSALRVTAKSQDGIIEGVEESGESFVVGVQFHPERLTSADRRWKRFFRRFVKECRRR